jgi:hypothetical protein
MPGNHYRGGAEPEEENGMGWGGLVPTAAERREEKRQEQLQRDARAGVAMAQRLEALMQRCRDDHHAPTYADLLIVKGTTQ